MSDNLPVLHSYSFADMQALANSIAKSRLFGIQTPDQALTLMAISQAEGRHPALAARDYDIIQGRPSKKAEAMQRDFLAAGGKIEWHALTDEQADATFSHPQGGSVRIVWDHARAKKAGLGGREMWGKYPRQMLRARAVSEGVRTVFPAATSGLYETGEVHDMGREMVDVTPAAAVAQSIGDQAKLNDPPHDPETGEIHEIVEREPFDRTVLLKQGEARARLGKDELGKWFAGLDRDELKAVGNENRKKWLQIAIVADNMALESGGPTPEQPAEGNLSGDNEPPPAEPLPYEEDAFGLPPLNGRETFCNEMLTVARTFTTHEQFDEMKTALGDGRTTRGRVAAKLPQDTYWALVRQIGEIEERLT